MAGLLVSPTVPQSVPGSRGQRVGRALAAWAGPLAVVAMLPDADLLWGRHNAETHSLGAAALAGLLVLAWTRGHAPRLAVAVALAWASHVALDWLGSDDAAPFGVMALWPFSTAYYLSDFSLFDPVDRRYWEPTFPVRLARALAKEALLLGLPATALTMVRLRRLRGRRPLVTVG